MSQAVFADAVYAIGLVNGMVRIEFAATSLLDRDDDGKQRLERQTAIVLTPQAFLQTFGKMKEFVAKMQDAGLIVDTRLERREGPARNTAVAPVIVKEGAAKPIKKSRKLVQ